MIKKMPVNTKISIKRLWNLVNAVQNGKTPQEIRERAAVAEEWISHNEAINKGKRFDIADDMMNALAYLVRESYHID